MESALAWDFFVKPPLNETIDLSAAPVQGLAEGHWSDSSSSLLDVL